MNQNLNSEILQKLSNKNPKARVKAIESIVQIVGANSFNFFFSSLNIYKITKDKSKVLSLIGDCTQDSDHRVRIAALKAFVTLHGEKLSFACDPFYQHAISLLSDDFVDVRIEALKFFWYTSFILLPFRFAWIHI